MKHISIFGLVLTLLCFSSASLADWGSFNSGWLRYDSSTYSKTCSAGSSRGKMNWRMIHRIIPPNSKVDVWLWSEVENTSTRSKTITAGVVTTIDAWDGNFIPFTYHEKRIGYGKKEALDNIVTTEFGVSVAGARSICRVTD